ncbi:MAG: diacylglycerol kinase family protein [Bacteroidota bacterium]
MRFAFVLNPAARSGRAARVALDLQTQARALGLDASVHLTDAPGHGTALAREVSREADAVIAVGGDGTVQEVVAGLVGSEAAFGIVPFGTGNDMAHALAMPTRLGPAMEALVAGLRSGPRPMDLGRVRWTEDGETIHERIFANCVGAGFDALAAIDALSFKRLGGKTAYLAAVARTLWYWREIEIEVEIRTTEAGTDAPFGLEGAGDLFYAGPYFLCEVGNGHSVGGGFLLTPDAVPDDGALDACLVRPLTLRRIARVLPLAMKAAHTNEPEISMTRAGRVAIRATLGALPVHADGEALTRSAQQIDVEVLPGAIRAIWGPGSDRK